jgi:hypothetical protein
VPVQLEARANGGAHAAEAADVSEDAEARPWRIPAFAYVVQHRLWAVQAAVATETDTYYGQLKNGKAEGYGVKRWPDWHVVYHGQWREGKREGHGVQHGPGGTVYHGQFIQDKKEGRVVISYASGERTFDRYEAGKKVSSFFGKHFLLRITRHGTRRRP